MEIGYHELVDRYDQVNGVFWVVGNKCIPNPKIPKDVYKYIKEKSFVGYC